MLGEGCVVFGVGGEVGGGLGLDGVGAEGHYPL